MTVAGCRIGRVRLKATGQEIRVVPPAKTSMPMKDLLEKAADHVEYFRDDEKATYLLITMGSNGRTYTSCHLEALGKNVIIAASIFKDLINRDFYMNNEIRYFCEQQGWIRE